MKGRFLPWLCLMAVIAVWMIIMILTRPNVAGYETHCVAPGDTLWGIAREYNPDIERIDMVLYEMRKANGMESSTIYVGQIIEVPIME